MYRTRSGPDSSSSGLNATIVGNWELLFGESRAILLGNQEALPGISRVKCAKTFWRSSMVNKSGQTIYERAEINEKAVYNLRQVLKNKPLEVIGHIDSLAYCCRNGTVAIVKVDLDEVVKPKK